jgi:two-component system sensor histidine kinase HydH
VETILSQALGQDAAQLAPEEKRLLLSRLLARLAHEVRNPLSSLDVHVQLLQEDLEQFDGQPRARAAGRLEIIRGELNRLESIVEHFLKLTGPASLDLEPVDLRQICGHVHRLVLPEANEHKINLALEVQEGLPLLQADGGQLTQAVLNLVLNALQAVKAGGQVAIRVAKPEGQMVSIEVSDNGPGVPEEHRASIFDPFFTTKKNGTGLGLWITQQIVLAHGGKIQVSAGAAGGAVFAVQLPVAGQRKPNGQVAN